MKTTTTVTINKNVNIAVTRMLYGDDVRDLCIKRNWYDAGDNTQYYNMLRMCNSSDCTPQSLHDIACDIFAHSSNINEQFGTENKDVCISGIMNALEHIAITIYDIN